MSNPSLCLNSSGVVLTVQSGSLDGQGISLDGDNDLNEKSWSCVSDGHVVHFLCILFFTGDKDLKEKSCSCVSHGHVVHFLCFRLLFSDSVFRVFDATEQPLGLLVCGWMNWTDKSRLGFGTCAESKTDRGMTGNLHSAVVEIRLLETASSGLNL